jgi:hypothetical protein
LAQIIRITSEALQATIRRLLPSQQGFGEDLQASNVIQPIIDLTPSAEGSDVPEQLQTALSFGSQNTFEVNGTSSNLVTGGGFYRIVGGLTIRPGSTGDRGGRITLSNGLTVKNVWSLLADDSSSNFQDAATFDLTVFLGQTEILGVNCNGGSLIAGSYRQVADANGVLVNPSGFTPQ